MRTTAVLSVLLVTFSCGGEPISPDGKVMVGDDGEEIETSAEAIKSYVSSGDYKSWTAEAAIHSGTGTSPHGRVRVFFNRKAVDALKAKSVSVPVGSMVVKELYGSSDSELVGAAAMVKSSATRWTWWEAFGASFDRPQAHGVDIAGCKGCHSGSGNQDQVLSKAP